MENPQPEPSMEEILASIRRIISEDEEEGSADAGKEAPKPAAAAKPALVGQPVKPAVPTPASARADEDGARARLATEDLEMIKRNAAMAASDEVEDVILDKGTEEAASAAFRTLSQSVRVTEGPGRTLEDIVVEMLRPMVKEWLNANLPSIVEEKVEEEVQRVARRRRG